MKINNWISWVGLSLVLAFCGHYYFADSTEINFNNTMKIEQRACGKNGCTISFVGNFDDKTTKIFIEENNLFESNINYSKDKVLDVEGKIKYRKLRPHFWIRERVIFFKIDGKETLIEEEVSLFYHIFRKMFSRD